MGEPWTSALIWAVATGVVAFVLTMLSPRKDKKPILAGISAAISMFIITALSIGFINPDFSFPLTRGLAGGYLIGTVVLIIVAGFFATVCSGLKTDRYSYSYSSDFPFSGRPAAGAFGLFLIVVIIIVAMGVTNPPGFFNNQQAQIYGLLNLEDAKEGQTQPDLDINVAQRVSPGHAKQKARNAIPREGSIGSYLQVGEPYLQGIRLNGSETPHPYYVVALTSTDFRSYAQAGNEVPGYILVDAADKDAPARWIPLDDEHTIKYVQGLGFWSGLDLDRHVYFNYALPNHVRVDELDGMEVDDDLQPWYTANILTPEAGVNQYYPTGMITVNPHTGEIVTYSMDEIPDWVDRRLPVHIADSLVASWAEYSNHQVSWPFDNSLNKKKIDDKSEVWSPDGLLLQYGLNTVGGNSNVLTDLIYVNPRTLAVTRYDAQGIIQSTVQETMQARAKSVFLQDLDVSILQIEWIAGRQVWYGVLEKDQKYWGVALVQTQLAGAADTSAYIVDSDLQTAVQRLRVQIATGTSPDEGGNLPNTLTTIQVDGIVDRIGSITYGSDKTPYINFTLRATFNGQQVLLPCQFAATDPRNAYLHEGDQVTVTLSTADTDSPNFVISITNNSYPIQWEQPTPAPTSQPEASPTS